MADVGAVTRFRMLIRALQPAEITNVPSELQADAATSLKYAVAIWQNHGGEANPSNPQLAHFALRIVRRFIRRQALEARVPAATAAASLTETAAVETEVDNDLGSDDA